jgi:hypothetical protein
MFPDVIASLLIVCEQISADVIHYLVIVRTFATLIQELETPRFLIVDHEVQVMVHRVKIECFKAKVVQVVDGDVRPGENVVEHILSVSGADLYLPHDVSQQAVKDCIDDNHVVLFAVEHDTVILFLSHANDYPILSARSTALELMLNSSLPLDKLSWLEDVHGFAELLDRQVKRRPAGNKEFQVALVVVGVVETINNEDSSDLSVSLIVDYLGERVLI